MRAILLVASLVIAVPDRPAPTPQKEPPKSLHEQMLGEWLFVKLTLGERIDPGMPNEVRTVRITANEIHVFVNGMARPEEGTAYKLDMTKQPAAIDLMPKQKIDNKDVYG